MQVERTDVDSFTIEYKAPLKLLWQKLVTEQVPILFVINESGKLYGVVTKGDLAKGANGGKDSNTDGLDPYSAGAICNRTPKSLKVDTSDDIIAKYFNDRIHCIPLLDDEGRLMQIAQPQKKNQRINLNIGAGSQVFESFINLDVKSDWYKEHHKSAREANFVEYDILSDDLPYEADSVDNIYISHVIEHLPDKAVMRLLSDCRRVIKVNGVVRIACPDVEFLASVSAFDNDFWFWRREWFRRHQSKMDPGSITQFDFLVREVATEKVGNLKASDYDQDCFSISSRESTLDSFVADLVFKEDKIGNHINYWTYDKLKTYAMSAGFKRIIRSKYQGCISLDMKGPDFDKTRPEMSLYVDLIKE